MKPNIFQKQALKVLNNSKKDRGIIVMPTGTGKTFLAVLWVKKILKKEPKATFLFICHNNDILAQANEKEFQKGLLKVPNISFGYYNGLKKERKQITFGTIQTLSKNLKKFPKDKFDYIIVDEAHHYQAKTFKVVLEYFKPKFLLGLTATPNRMDGISISKIFGEPLFLATTHEAIKNKMLSKFKYYNVENDIDFEKIPTKKGRYKVNDLNKHLCIKEYDKSIFDEYKKNKRKFKFKKTICFCATVEHSHRMNNIFKSKGIKSVVFTGIKQLTFSSNKKTFKFFPSKERKKILQEFRNGKYEIIFVRDLFNEGVDIPDADCLMFLRPTTSSIIFTQQIGRGLRKSKGKEHLICLDFVGNSLKCELNYQVLGEILKVDLKKAIRKAKKEMKMRKRKKFMIFRMGCYIVLTPKEINILEKRLGRILTKQDVIDKYNELKKKLGRVPLKKEMKIKWATLKRLTNMNYEDFVKSLGDKAEFSSKRWNKQNIINRYNELKKKLGRVPNLIKEFRTNQKMFQRHFNMSYSEFVKSRGDTPRKIINHYNKSTTKQDIIDKYNELKKKLGRVPNFKELKENLKMNSRTFQKRVGKIWKDFLIEKEGTTKGLRRTINKSIKPTLKSNKKNVKFFEVKGIITSKENIEKIKKDNDEKGKLRCELSKTLSKNGFHNTKEKDKFRPLLLKEIKDGDTILLLESPKLKAIKEIENLKIKPKRIVIPNNFEFKKLCEALNLYQTDLKIDVYNMSALQFLMNTQRKFNFVWLDYCGAFTYYINDLEVALKKFKDVKLFVTYNIFDVSRKGRDYFGRVIDFVLSKRTDVRLYPSLTQRYKTMFYNIGFKLGEYINE